MNKRLSYNIITYICLMVLFSVTLIIGIFIDHKLAAELYSENNIPAVILSIIGVYLYYGSMVFFQGVLIRQISLTDIKPAAKILWGIIYTYFAISTSTYGAAALLSNSVCGLFLRNNPHTLVHYMTSGLYLFLPLYPLGIILNGRKCDKKAIKDLIIILIIMTIATFSSNIVKRLVMRPRYRITLTGYESTTKLLTDDLASFFSGHAMNAALGMIIYPAFKHVFSGLQDKEKLIRIIAVIILIPIVISRMILGNHYLSDISFGAIIGLFFCIIYDLTYKKVINQ